MRSYRRLSVLAVLLTATWSCEQAPEPVGKVTVAPAAVALPYPGYTVLELEWEMREPLEAVQGEPMVFVHLIDADGTVERTFDHPLPFPWEKGSSQTYSVPLYQSGLAPPLEAGNYRLTLGLYDIGGRRWALADSGEQVAEMEYQVASVATEGDPSAVPMFYFSPSWLPLEAGTDVQILGRRWLTGEGTIRVAEIPAAGSVWMSLKISPAERGREELSMNEGEATPTVTVAGTCGGEPIRVSDYGVHQIEMPVAADAEGRLPDECEITLLPNFQIVETDKLTRRSVGLEVLSWSVD